MNRAQNLSRRKVAATFLSSALCAGSLLAITSKAGTSPAAPEALERRTVPSEAPPAVVLAAGMLVFVDPQTGRILERPTSAQQRALLRLRAEQAARTGEEQDRLLDSLEPFPVPGGIGLDVRGLLTSSLVVHRAADGTLHYSCEEDHAAATREPGADHR